MGSKAYPPHLRWILLIVIGGLIFISPSPVFAQKQTVPIPAIKIIVGEAKDTGEVSPLLQFLFLLTVLSLAPAILIMMTSFTRLIVVFSFLRQAIGTPQMPPNQVMMGLALFLTFFIMTPVWHNIHENALVPYMDKKISQPQAIDEALKPVRKFMFKQTREKDLALFIRLAKAPIPKNMEEIPTTILLPAFMISELKTAFQIAFLLYIPFLVIDMVVSSVLLSIGMIMLPPLMVSLPLKLLLFVLVDGWYLIVGSMVKSFY